ncbi:biotin-dependent 2-oxo acid dehydrogenase [Grosmannia clavigera kw1407]|uniref:Dihydrolipoamide acetyltransferase component of pyruvate dehydrogenase complex n=1 Tax=Grosmannia clavigera (strain kw1407 / UAMH 11150) TaxID=655863 RepID=F0XIF8_GROCL|nr:biotin-dependent 2-oxo acid dehydrogenase [Grosmannia clavigera kw1407]EFX02527.1 biotin-dependent 2-oxo acid dehydrogenase [Grosmannia clavigera kw1407]
MFRQRSCWALTPAIRVVVGGYRISATTALAASPKFESRLLGSCLPTSPRARYLHTSSRLLAVKPLLLADIGEGIVECEIIQWFVEPGATVEEFSPLCEVQSDKASVEITSRFAGVVKKLHYEAGDMAKVGKAFVDIDIAEEAVQNPDETAVETATVPGADITSAELTAPEKEVTTPTSAQQSLQEQPQNLTRLASPTGGKKKFSGSSLATPAVRHLCKELAVNITQVDGTGKDGRVLKEDLYRFVEERKVAAPSPASASTTQPALAAALDTKDAPQQETAVPLTGMPLQMFRTMTKSLAIPHFLYADEVDFTQLFRLRQRANVALARTAGQATGEGDVNKISYLPFVIKALSLALNRYPVLNARVEVPSDSAEKPRLVYRSQHNIGVAMDTPVGLVVPVVRNVNGRSVLSIAGELVRLQQIAQVGKLAPADLQGGTITVSNIGNIGGTYLSPVVVEREVAILGIGRLRTVPAFADDSDEGEGAAGQRIIKRHVCHFSFSADHRVVDGATVARAAEVVRELVEQPDTMIMQLR